MRRPSAWAGWLALLCAGAAPGQDTLEAPEALQAGGKTIDVEIGHAAPFVCDWNGDGKRDLLVGQFGGGKLAIHENTGSAAEPALGAAAWFHGTVEAG